jgi:HD-GYP domain-containing protein (c-di-GMP phosphodiesterase class II)
MSDMVYGSRTGGLLAPTDVRVPDLPHADVLSHIGLRALAPHRRNTRELSGTVFAVLASMAAALLVVDRLGGGNEELVTTMHLPILLAALFYGPLGGAATGAAATGLLASPLSPHLYPSPAAQLVGGASNLIFGVGSGILLAILKNHRVTLTQTLGRLEHTYGRTLALIAHAVELRDLDTAGHSERVAVNARALGVELGLEDDDLARLYWAGLLHDVGKIVVPESVLHKPDALSAEEWALMHSHVSVGEELIRQASPDFLAVAEAVGAHHEKWDGTGYPMHRSREHIPLLGRILAVADVFEALTCPRPYRSALTADMAMTALRSGSGRHFDPNVVERFERLLVSGRLVIADPSSTGLRWQIPVMRTPIA